MDKFFEKLDNYNLFTNIIPGYLLIVFNVYYFDISNVNYLELILLAYFVGQTLSRVGSIMIGPLLLKITNEDGETYKKYISACDIDSKIETLMQERNMYRTFCSLAIVCILEILLDKILSVISISNDFVFVLLLIFVVVIYGISFCKHNKYITARVRNCTDSKSKSSCGIKK